ncbi:S8 family serine peptidase [Roseomonas fluvialis]|nr:S8 family serine peptidase [Roseomonas fluvialis]
MIPLDPAPPQDGPSTVVIAPLARRAARPKLDARLAYLAGLSPEQLHRLKATEDAVFARFAGTQGGDTSPSPSFAPLSAGVLLPASTAAPWRDGGLCARLSEATFSVLILGSASARDLIEVGVRPRSRSGDVVTALLPLSSLRRVEALDRIAFIELARAWRHDLDEAIPFAGIDALHGATPSVDGSGTIIGIIDNVIDIYHPDFRDAQNKTRLLSIWDQTLTPTGTETGPPLHPALPGFLPDLGAAYGVEYRRAAIDAELSAFNPPPVPPYQIVRHAPPDPAVTPKPVVDAATHGSMVAGCAAGNGRGGGAPGAAPGSSIIFVSPLSYDSGVMLNADNTAILDGCAYIFARAQETGRPCVVNISLGDNQGPHDGTTCGERFLDSLLGVPGRAIVLSAGNSTTTAAHAEGIVAPGAPERLVLRYAANPSDPTDLPRNSDTIEIWYAGLDRITATLTVPTTPATVIGPIDAGSASGDVIVGGVTVSITSAVNDPRNGDNVLTILIVVPDGASVPLGDWQILLTGTTITHGAFHGWVDRNNRGKSMWMPPHRQESRRTIGVPATARLPITVGNHGPTANPPAIWGTSGLGPTRDGRVKPDIAAMGRNISAPVPRNMRTVPPGAATYASATGTSYSAPIVAGAAALLFQCRSPAVTCATIKQILTQTAGTTGLAIPSNAFGQGYLQMGAACEATIV